MLVNICFGFIMLIASLIESSVPKTRMSEKHNIQLGNFDLPSLGVIWFCWPTCGVLARRNEESLKRQRTEKNRALLNFSRSLRRSAKLLVQNAQFCATQRECLTTETPSIGNAVQSSETLRNSLGLNYKLAALNRLSYAGVPVRKRFSAG